MQRLRQQLRRLGPHFRTVLLRGETGTGKELVARTLHSYSSHAAGPFVIYNSALQAEHGVASTASGANFPVAEEDIAGLMKRAHRGTVFLDQIGEMSAGSAGRCTGSTAEHGTAAAAPDRSATGWRRA